MISALGPSNCDMQLSVKKAFNLFVLGLGQWRNGRKSGLGIMLSWMGHSFIGANENGLMEGFGFFTHSDGTKFEGT